MGSGCFLRVCLHEYGRIRVCPAAAFLFYLYTGRLQTYTNCVMITLESAEVEEEL